MPTSPIKNKFSPSLASISSAKVKVKDNDGLASAPPVGDLLDGKLLNAPKKNPAARMLDGAKSAGVTMRKGAGQIGNSMAGGFKAGISGINSGAQSVAANAKASINTLGRGTQNLGKSVAGTTKASIDSISRGSRSLGGKIAGGTKAAGNRAKALAGTVQGGLKTAATKVRAFFARLGTQLSGGFSKLFGKKAPAATEPAAPAADPVLSAEVEASTQA